MVRHGAAVIRVTERASALVLLGSRDLLLAKANLLDLTSAR
ncbi:hypothetical protein ACULPM_02805 [Thermophilibacter sp. ZX-H3]|nr:hypothetical protein [Olsenella sp. SW781]